MPEIRRVFSSNKVILNEDDSYHIVRFSDTSNIYLSCVDWPDGETCIVLTQEQLLEFISNLQAHVILENK